MFNIEMQSPIPIFIQLEKQIRKYVVLGILKADDQLPSTRALSYELGVNPNTISKAYQELENLGYIYVQKGKGCFIHKQSRELIIKDELESFKENVENIHSLNISKEDLLSIIERIYRGEDK